MILKAPRLSANLLCQQESVWTWNGTTRKGKQGRIFVLATTTLLWLGVQLALLCIRSHAGSELMSQLVTIFRPEVRHPLFVVSSDCSQVGLELLIDDILYRSSDYQGYGSSRAGLRPGEYGLRLAIPSLQPFTC